MERLPQGVFDIIGSYCNFARDDIEYFLAGTRHRRNVSSVNKIFAANFYDSILKQKLAQMPISSAPIWCMLYTNQEFGEYRQPWWQSTGDASDEDIAEYDFWCQQISHFETWWMDNPKSRVELIVYQPPARIGAAVAQERL